MKEKKMGPTPIAGSEPELPELNLLCLQCPPTGETYDGDRSLACSSPVVFRDLPSKRRILLAGRNALINKICPGTQPTATSLGRLALGMTI